MKEDSKSSYTRRIIPKAPKSPFDGQDIHFGTYQGRFERFAIKGLPRAFGNLPISIFLTNRRVNSLMRLLFQSEQIIGEITFL